MSLTNIAVTQPTFIDGALRPAGWSGHVDIKKEFGVDKLSAKDTPNVHRVSGTGEMMSYEVAALSPTGPSPTMPQASPAGAIHATADGIAMAAEPGGASDGVIVVAEGSEAAAAASEAAAKPARTATARGR